MEFLLINHPLDCPVCDKGGECPLQNQAMSNGRGESRFDGRSSAPSPSRSTSQPRSCSTASAACCARAAPGSPTRSPATRSSRCIERGALQQVGIYEEEPFESYFSGNTIQICPVGALTGAAYRFRARPFDLVSTPGGRPSTTPAAAAHPRRPPPRQGDAPARRRRPRGQRGVDHCDKDRFAFTYARAGDRLTHPLVRDEDRRAAARLVARGVRASPPAACAPRRAAGVLTGGRVTARGRLRLRQVRPGGAGHQRHRLPGPAALAPRRPTSSALDAWPAPALGVTYADLERRPAVVLVGLEPEDEAGIALPAAAQGVRARRACGLRRSRPFASRGLPKMGGTLIRTAPGGGGRAPSTALAAATVDAALRRPGGGVILVGERLADGARRAARRRGAWPTPPAPALAWVPRRAGDRGAVEAGCLPDPAARRPPGRRRRGPCRRRRGLGRGRSREAPGRDTAGIVAAAASGDARRAASSAGSTPTTLPTPPARRAALDAAGFVVSLELRATDVTDVRRRRPPGRRRSPRRPAPSSTGRAGRGPSRPCSTRATSLPDLRVLAGSPTSWARRPRASARVARGARRAGRSSAPGTARAPRRRRRRGRRPSPESADGHAWCSRPGSSCSTTGAMQDGEPHLAGTAPAPVARVSPATAAGARRRRR